MRMAFYGDEIVERHGTEFAFFAVTNGNGAGFLFLRTDDTKIRNQIESAFTDFRADFFGVVIARNTNSGIQKFLHESFGQRPDYPEVNRSNEPNGARWIITGLCGLLSGPMYSRSNRSALGRL